MNSATQQAMGALKFGDHVTYAENHFAVVLNAQPEFDQYEIAYRQYDGGGQEYWKTAIARLADLALRSEPPGSVSDEVIRAGDALGHIANVCYGTHGHTNGSHDEITKAIRAWKRAKSSTPAVPSVEEIMEMFADAMKRNNEALATEFFRSRITQALRSPTVDGRSGSNVPSGSPAVGSPPPHEQAHGQATAPSIPNATHPQDPDAR